MEGIEPTVLYLTLTPAEVAHVERLVDSLTGGTRQTPLHSVFAPAHLAAAELPLRIRSAFYDLRLHEGALAICVRGNPIEHAAIGPTPRKLRPAGEAELATREECIHILYASLLGEPFTWNTIQNGYVVNDIIPVPEDEGKPLSSGSANPFGLHTEDAFHMLAGDYLGLMCLRNPDRVPTVISTVVPSALPPNAVSVLAEPRFVVGANLAHAVRSGSERRPILFGDLRQPYIRINLNVSAQVDDDEEAAWALNVLAAHLEENVHDIILESGDCFFLDNYRAPHGRRAFSPHYDGSDRWLKRLYITSSLRASRHLRAHPDSRLVMLDRPPA